MGTKRESQQLFKNILNGPINRPIGERNVIPIAQINSLQVLTEADRHERTNSVVALFRKCQQDSTHTLSRRFHIPFTTQITDNFVGIERQNGIPLRYSH